MIFSRFKNGSIIGGVIISVFFHLAWTDCFAQDAQSDAAGAYLQVYEATQLALLQDPVIQNGIYYSYPYYNANGHPFLGQKEFASGSVVFRGKTYEDLSINYDLFNQQLILSREYDGVLQMNLLASQFVSGFHLKGKQFILADFQTGTSDYYQVISETGTISCYYSWYKERREIHDSGNRSIYSFSEQKNKRYLLLDGQLHRYKNNKSFIKIFPDARRAMIKAYLQDHQILVMETSDQTMESLMEYCDGILNQDSNQGGE